MRAEFDREKLLQFSRQFRKKAPKAVKSLQSQFGYTRDQNSVGNTYLRSIIARITTHPAKRIDGLLPWNIKL